MSGVAPSVDDELLVVGDVREREALMPALDHWGPRAVGVDDVAAALPRMTAATAAVLLLAGAAPGAELRRLLDGAGAFDPAVLLLVAPDALDGEGAAELYDVGAAAVLAWPAESLLVARIIDELIGPSTPTIDELGDPGSGSALDQAVRARLTADTVLQAMGVRVLEGTAVLRGTVASAWERARLRRLVETVPGIARVIDHGVAVQDVHVSDEELRTVVDATLRSVGNTEARGLTIDVHGAIATLRGVAGSREVASRVCNALRRIPGIRRAYDATLGSS